MCENKGRDAFLTDLLCKYIFYSQSVFLGFAEEEYTNKFFADIA